MRVGDVGMTTPQDSPGPSGVLLGAHGCSQLSSQNYFHLNHPPTYLGRPQ